LNRPYFSRITAQTLWNARNLLGDGRGRSQLARAVSGLPSGSTGRRMFWAPILDFDRDRLAHDRAARFHHLLESIA